MTWFWFGIIAAVLYAVGEIISKFVADEQSEPAVIGSIAAFYAGVICFVIAVVQGQATTSFQLFPTLGMIASATAYGIGIITYYDAIKNSDVSEFAILSRMTILFTLLGGIFIYGERFVPIQMVGMSVVIVGTILLTWEKKRIRLHHGSVMAICTAVLFSIGILIDKKVIAYFPAALYSSINYFVSTLVLIPFAYISLRRKPHFPIAKTHGYLFIAAFFYSLSAYCVYRAYQSHGPVSLMSMLGQLQIPVVVLYGIFILKEKNRTLGKFTAMTLMIIGAYLLNR